MAHVDPLDEVLALVAQRQVRVPITPGTLASEELDVDLAASVAAALLCRATDQLSAHDDAVARAKAALGEATRVRDRVATRRERLTAIRDEGIARARAARGA